MDRKEKMIVALTGCSHALTHGYMGGDERDSLRHFLLLGFRIRFSGLKLFRVRCSTFWIAVGLFGTKQQCLSSHLHRPLYSEDEVPQKGSSVITF